jgi:cytochrome c oxidase cbb3-type subunit 3
MSSFWSAWVTIIQLGTVFACAIGLYIIIKSQPLDKKPDTPTGHSYDGIEEYDNPLPKWWVVMFIGLMIFGLVYYFLYPGLGNYKGYLGWTSHGAWEKAEKAYEAKTAPMFAAFSKTSIEELSKDPKALRIGKSIFENNCAVCHGSTGKGSIGFPNLTDNDWLYGGSPDQIVTTITNGRQGHMPAKGLKPDMTAENVDQLANYLLSFSGREKDKAAAAKGKALFQVACVACHGPDAKGNQAIGSANLTDNTWLYGSTYKNIVQTITHGRGGVMPVWKDALDKDRIHVVAAYVYSLSHK